MSKLKEPTFGGGDGINPNTVRALFAVMVKENGWENVSWADFRNHAGRNLRCFATDSRWIPGQKVRDYFASLDGGGVALRAFHTLWENDAHKKGKKTLNAYGMRDSSGNKKTGNSAKRSGNSDRSAVKKLIFDALLSGEIRGEDINDDIRDYLASAD